LFLLLGGLTAAVYFWLYFDISVEIPRQEIMGTTFGGGRVANLSLMAERQNGMLMSIVAACAGGILLYLGERKK